MSKTIKTILWVAGAAVVLGGIWWWSASQPNSPAPAATQTTAPTSTAQSAGGTQASELASGNSTSNAALNSDLAQIDSQMNGMSGDNASITQGMNDQPVQQSQL